MIDGFVLNWIWLFVALCALAFLGYGTRTFDWWSSPFFTLGLVFSALIASKAAQPMLLAPLESWVRAWLPSGSSAMTGLTVFVIVGSAALLSVACVVLLGVLIGRVRVRGDREALEDGASGTGLAGDGLGR